MSNIVLASSNPGKLHEIQQLLENTDYTIVPQSEYDVIDADETGLTYVENAIIKARNACAVTQLPSIADDSGLSVNALGGEPGIHSARYSGHGAEANNVKLLAAMRDISDEQRLARYYCICVFMQHEKDPCPIICQGTWDGVIAHEVKGKNGFGYDPIFYLPEQKCTVAELANEVKQSLSHRAKAFMQLREFMSSSVTSVI